MEINNLLVKKGSNPHRSSVPVDLPVAKRKALVRRVPTATGRIGLKAPHGALRRPFLRYGKDRGRATAPAHDAPCLYSVSSTLAPPPFLAPSVDLTVVVSEVTALVVTLVTIPSIIRARRLRSSKYAFNLDLMPGRRFDSRSVSAWIAILTLPEPAVPNGSLPCTRTFIASHSC